MTAFFALLWLITLIMIPVAFYAPKFSTRGLIKSSGRASILYIVVMIASFLAIGITAPTASTEDHLAAQKIQQNLTPPELITATESAELIPTTTTAPTPTPKPTKTPRPTQIPKPQGGEITPVAASTSSAEVSD